MTIPIPIGVKWIASANGSFWKVVSCGQCKQSYAYLMELEASGADIDLLLLDTEGATQRAQERAEQNLSKMSQNMVLPLPCPNCGFYQDDMVARLKEDGMSKRLFTAGLAVAVLSLIPLAFSVPYIWLLTVFGVTGGVAMMGYADFSAARFDPNTGDPELRKAKGRKYAIWGEQLSKLTATVPTAKQVASSDQSRESDFANEPPGSDEG